MQTLMCRMLGLVKSTGCMGSLCVCLGLEGGMDSQLVRAMVRGWARGKEIIWGRGPDTKNTPSRKREMRRGIEKHGG